MKKELAYWVTLAHMPEIKTKIKNKIIARFYLEGKTVIDFFNAGENTWKNHYNLSEKEIKILKQNIEKLGNNAFLVESLLEQGYKIIPIISPEYSPTLKKNLKYSSPVVLYAKGDLQLLQKEAVAIVGSRKANEISLIFTENIAKNAAENSKVVVSGYAKGVDRKALDSALKYGGQSIIVLPQGITTFQSGFKKYYKHIISGDVLVVSIFHPNARWSVGLAMARNPIIYGLANEIFVAQSDNKGGTWAGVLDGLKKGRTIYIRKPEHQEKNANNLLIQKGAKPVDLKGNLIIGAIKIIREPESEYNSIETRIKELLKQGTYSSKEIVNKLNLDWNPIKLTNFLKKQKEIIVIKKKPLRFTLNSRKAKVSQRKLFEEME